jgi:antitoxin component YwqK of YwqJK toxin-antitoxin module
VFWTRKIKKEYYENGVLKSEANFRGSRRDGVTRRYYENGTLMIEANFKSGEPHGKFREYYENANMMAEEVYNGGQLIIQKRFDRNGNINDIARRYYQNGQIRIEAGFRNGKPEGITREYHENGSLMAEEYYSNGTLISWKGYDRSGTLMVALKEFYDNGHAKNETDFQEGIYKEYFKSGAIRIDARFKDKKPHGLIKEYYEEGILAAEDGYEFGRHVGSRRYSRLGNLVASTGKLKEPEPVVLEGKREEGNVFKEYIEQMEHAPAEEQKTQAPPVVQEMKPEIKEEPKKEIAEKPVEEKKIEPKPKRSLNRIEALREALSAKAGKENEIKKQQPAEPKAEEPQKPVENEPPKAEEKKEDKNIEFVRNEIEKALEGKLEVEKKEDELRTEEIGKEPQIEMTGEEKTVKEYYLSGAVKIERTYKGDKLHGVTKEYYESGELMAELFYINGELDSQTRFDKTGRFFYKWKK